jgi:hypothetical protein
LFFKIIGLGKVSNGILFPKLMLDKHCIKRIMQEFPQLQQQHQRHRTAERHSENSVKVKNPVTDYKVEYNFDFPEKYEKQSDQSLINVKGNLRKKIIILEKCSPNPHRHG